MDILYYFFDNRFMRNSVTGVRFREPLNRGEVRSYINKRKNVYISKDSEENVCPKEFLNNRYDHDIIKANHKKFMRTGLVQKTSAGRSTYKEKSWHLAPNRYGSESQPFGSKCGLKGAYWRKLPKTKSRKQILRKPAYRFYDLPRDIEKMSGRCCSYKGKFLTSKISSKR